MSKRCHVPPPQNPPCYICRKSAISMTGIFPTSILGNSSKGIFDEGDRQVLHKGPPGRVHQHTHTHIGSGRYFEIQHSNFPFPYMHLQNLWLRIVSCLEVSLQWPYRAKCQRRFSPVPSSGVACGHWRTAAFVITVCTRH